MFKTTLLFCAVLAAACAADGYEESTAAELAVHDLPAPGSLSSPAEGFAAYDSSIDASGHCGDGSMRPGPQVFTDYVANFSISATTYPACGGFHAFDQALDIWIFGHDAKQAFANWLTANNSEMARRLGLTQIIWNHQMWRSYTGGSGPQGDWGPYNGGNPHTDHVHISFGEAGAQGVTSFFTEAIGHGLVRRYAFQANTHELWTNDGPTGLGMMASTSPAVGGTHVAFQANTGELYIDGAPTGFGMMAGTSPSITADRNFAFQANTSYLFVDGVDLQLGMRAGTSPDIATLASGDTIVAFQANTGELWVGGAPTGLGMMAGTSPSIAGLTHGGYVVAFQANTSELWVAGAPTGFGMMAGTSPSVAALADGGHVVAFQANTGELWIGGRPTGLGMAAGTSPSVGPDGTVLFQANTGELWEVDASGGHPRGLGMASTTSPAN